MTASTGVGRGKHHLGKGKCIRWIREHQNYAGDDCLIWPYNKCFGYGIFGYNGQKGIYVHRFMCELANGPPPTPKHQAAHTCGKGHDGCANPRHLVWKTASENQLDRRRHGTHVLNPDGQKGRLTEQQRQEIREIGDRMKLFDIADRYGISTRHVRRIQKIKRQRGCAAYRSPQSNVTER
jgi:hypothetical protein